MRGRPRPPASQDGRDRLLEGLTDLALVIQLDLVIQLALVIQLRSGRPVVPSDADLEPALVETSHFEAEDLAPQNTVLHAALRRRGPA